MIFYHTTDSAESILNGGFRDNSGSYMFAEIILTGVFLSNRPADVNEGAKGDQVLEVSFTEGIELGEYELVPEEQETPFREWCVPAALINEHAQVRLMSDDELEDLFIHQLDPEVVAQIRAKFPVRIVGQGEAPGEL